MWWLIGSVIYLIVGLVAFKVSYGHLRGNQLADLNIAQSTTGTTEDQ